VNNKRIDDHEELQRLRKLVVNEWLEETN